MNYGIHEMIEIRERELRDRQIDRIREIREAIDERRAGGEVREAVGAAMIRFGAWVAGQAADEIDAARGRVPSAG